MTTETTADLFEEIHFLKDDWFKEINLKKQEINCGDYYPSPYRIQLAHRIFITGQRAEMNGYLQIAVEQYRRATCLVNDIERIMKCSDFSQRIVEKTVASSERQCINIAFADVSSEDSFIHTDQDHRILLSDNNDAPILQLPDELLLLIMKWIVGSSLDVHSLVLQSLVCKKFLALSRDEQLWRLISLRLWSTCSPSDVCHFGGSWMSMVKVRPHVLYHGCYIGATSYVRKGEFTANTVTTPFLLVRYFRVFRFRTDGSVVMVTSAQDPQEIIRLISLLDQSNSSTCKLGSMMTNSHSVATGTYLVDNDMVYLNLTRPTESSSSVALMRNRRLITTDEPTKHHLEISFQIKSSTGYPNRMMRWKSFSLTVIRRNDVAVTQFETSSDKYPTIIFSRVREFCSRLSQDHL